MVDSLPCPLLSLMSHPGTQQRPSQRGNPEPGQTWLVLKAWEESKSVRPIPSFTKVSLASPGLTSFVPSRRQQQKVPC